jgi:spermidine synthase
MAHTRLDPPANRLVLGPAGEFITSRGPEAGIETESGAGFLISLRLLAGTPMISRILRCARLILQPGFAEFSISALSGILIAAWLHQAVALVGASRPAISSILLIAGVSIVCGLAAARWLGTTCRLRKNSLLFPLAIMFVTGLFSGRLVQLEGFFFTSMAPVGSWPGGVSRFLMFLAAHSVLILPFSAAVCAASLPFCRNHTDSNGLSARPLAGIAAGVVLASCGMLPLFGAEITTVCAACLAAALTGIAFQQNRRLNLDRDSVVDAPVGRSESSRGRIPGAINAALYGVGFVCLSRILDQLFLDAAWISAVEFSSLLAGAATGVLSGRRFSLSETAPLWMAACLAAAAALFPVGIRASLEISAYVSLPAGVALCRAVLIAVILMPVGAALAMSRVNAAGHCISGFSIVLFVFGMIAARWLVVSTIGPVAGLAMVATVLTVSTSIILLISREVRGPSAKPAVAAGIVAVLTAPFWMSQYEPDRSARMLFDTGVFLAHRVELRTDILEHLDEARCLETLESETGTLSLWRSRGTRLQIRESGMPQSSINVRPEIAPQPSGEALQAILPLVLHDKPASVLILGLGTGVTLQTTLQFPVSRISCVEGDSNLIDLVSHRILSRLAPNPLNDERVEIVNCEPVAAAASARDFDIIVCSTNHMSQPASAVEATAEFLSRAAGGLTERGLLCQRFRYVDFGAATVRSVLATWQSVFEHVAAIETAPGEWLLIGTKDSAGLYREGLVERLQRQHVRHALSGLGFDWATPLQLTVFDGDLLRQHFEQSNQLSEGTGAIQTAASASMLSAGPWDVMRWGAKFAQVQQSVGPAARRLAKVFTDETSSADVQRRLTELDMRRDLIHKSADRYWAYRGELKRKLKESPRAEIVQVSGGQETRLHPEEKRRVEYFTSLGHAAGLEKPTSEALRPVEEFAAPYDPFISFFMHQEIAELAARDSKSNSAIEFRHRLYRVNFTSSRDRSIRNLITAIHLLCDHPELIPDDAERGDQLDAFLQILHRRWQNRGDIGPDSSVVALNDIQKSLEAGERVFDVLKKVGPARNKSDDDVALRKLAIEKSLMRPLRTYRKRLMKHKDIQQAIRSR